MDDKAKYTARAMYVLHLASMIDRSDDRRATDPLCALYAILLLHKSVAMKVLTRLGVDREALERRVKTELGKRWTADSRSAGVDTVTQEQPARISPSSLHIPEFGPAIGTENILCGIAETDGIAKEILSGVGVTAEAVKIQISLMIKGE